MSIKGESITPDSVRAYQQGQLAIENGETCLPELLPLPSRSISDWLYGEGHSQLAFLKTRQQYMDYCTDRRVAALKALVEKHQPAVVVFYSLHAWYKPKWEQIAGVIFALHEIAGWKLLIGQNEKTVFAITAHPAAKGISNAYFQEVGRIIAAKISRLS